MNDTLPASKERMRNRFLMLTAIALGSLAGIQFLRSRPPSASYSDEEARQMRFASAKELEQDQSDTKALFDDSFNKGRFSESEFATARKALETGSFARRTKMLLYIGRLKGPDQHRLALDLIGDKPLSADDQASWKSVFRYWTQDKSDPRVLSTLLANPNAQVRALAEEVQHERQ